MKIKELRQKSELELKRLLAESREKLRDMRFKAAQRQLKKVRDIRVAKKTISRILTILEENQEARKSGSPEVGSQEVGKPGEAENKVD